uniref:Uncharacterized protein n=1 Tax=Ditylenchus dipsaci TaxID=166011 RepID=A0A915DSC9_9BILA
MKLRKLLQFFEDECNWHFVDLLSFTWIDGFCGVCNGSSSHLLCLPFFSFILPLLSGIAASITSVYALLLHNPNGCELFLQFFSLILGFLLFVATATEAVCLRRVQAERGEQSVCAGVLNRTLGSQLKCSDVFLSLQDHLLLKIGPQPSNVEHLEESRRTVQIALSTVLAVASLVQFSTGLILTLYSAAENKFQLSAPHWQAIFGIFTLLYSYVYHAYCCVFFHSYFVTLVAVYCLIQAGVPWHFPARTSSRQFFSVVGAGLSTALLALTSFGFYCWANRHAAPWKFDRDLSNFLYSQSYWNSTIDKDKTMTNGLFRYCHKPKQMYMLCERTLEFSKPYIWWTQEQVEGEAELIQAMVLILLTLNACIHFLLFVYDAFGN